MEISEHELRSMTRDMDDMHHATLPAMRESLAELTDKVRSSRRGFLVGTGLALALAACGRGGGGTSAQPAPSGDAKLEGDLRVVGLAAALENLAVGTYDAGITAATAGKLGMVPPAIVTFATTAKSHHEAHAAAWNGVLKSAGKKEIAGVPLSIKPQVDEQLAMVKDVQGLAKLALSLEDVAAATYLSGLGAISDMGGIRTAATILPVETQHAAILNFVLGQYPVPKAFRDVTGAVGPEALSA